MKIDFWKMHGAGNDFILVDDRPSRFPINHTAWIATLADRRRGVGCDGIILIQSSDRAEARMRFINPDGAEVEMCGNGARCFARLAHELGAVPRTMTIETAAGLLRAEVMEQAVRIALSKPHGWRMDQALDLDDGRRPYAFVNTGVPHAVFEVQDLEHYPVEQAGRAIRRHAAFVPDGTNANFMTVSGAQRLALRTYERGVEAETLACGTGAAAAALVAARQARVTPPVEVVVRSGSVLTIDFELTPGGATNVSLLGPTEHVFTGTLEYPP